MTSAEGAHTPARWAATVSLVTRNLRTPLAATVAALALTSAMVACGNDHSTAHTSGSGSGHEHPVGQLDASQATFTKGSDGLWYTTYGDTVEVSAWEPGTEPTDEQRRAGEDFAAQVRSALAGIVTVEDARTAGYVHHESIDEFHLVNDSHATDGVELDPNRPEFLVIDPDAGLVLGAMFLWPPGQHGPQIAGPASVWHFHPAESTTDAFRCWDGFLPIVGAYNAATDRCSSGERRDQSPEMLHVWTINHPGGRFATPMPSRS